MGRLYVHFLELVFNEKIFHFQAKGLSYASHGFRIVRFSIFDVADRSLVDAGNGGNPFLVPALDQSGSLDFRSVVSHCKATLHVRRQLVNIFVRKNTSGVQNGQMDTGDRLEFFRLKAHHTEESLAAESKVSRVTISSIENRRSSPTVATLTVLAKACGVTLGEFFQEYGPRELSEEHQKLHAKLQEILNGDEKAAAGIAVNIDYLHGHMMAIMQQKAEEIRKLSKRRKAAG
jgi:transcriptional regulator with XRE-family HTH domain